MLTMQASSIKGKVAFISGSSKGIGFEIAKVFALHGAQVILCSRNEENLVRAQLEIEALGGKADRYCAHFGRHEEIEAVLDKVINKYSRIDILVNNFGINPVHQPLVDMELEMWQKMLTYNLTNYFYTSKVVARHMIQNKRGKIINISSVAGQHPFKNLGAYCVVKSGIDMLTKVLAQELADYGINVNGIAPGYVETSFHRTRTDLPSRELMLASIPIKHIGQPADIANAAYFLACDESKYITGETITIDGGFVRLR